MRPPMGRVHYAIDSCPLGSFVGQIWGMPKIDPIFQGNFKYGSISTQVTATNPFYHQWYTYICPLTCHKKIGQKLAGLAKNWVFRKIVKSGFWQIWQAFFDMVFTFLQSSWIILEGKKIKSLGYQELTQYFLRYNKQSWNFPVLMEGALWRSFMNVQKFSRIEK